MNKLFSNINNMTETENGRATYKSSTSPLVDAFFNLSVLRKAPDEQIIETFSKAFTENKLLATKLLFYVRDIRGGQGERRVFRVILKWLSDNHPKVILDNLHLIPYYGRWDDLFVLLNGKENEVHIAAMNFYVEALREHNSLAAKWCPREGKSPVYEILRKRMGLTPKSFRKMLVYSTDVVESKMCSSKWRDIDYAKLPSAAHSKYRKAFIRHDETEYSLYLEAVKAGKSKINAGAIFPYTIYSQLRELIKSSYDKLAVESAVLQWESLPDYMSSKANILPVVDTSGSMSWATLKDSKVTCMDVACSLGLYVAERNKGKFNNCICTFSNRPTFADLSGKSLTDKILEIEGLEWGNTDLDAVFRKILSTAVDSKLSQEEMPEYILIMSDMQFDQGVYSNLTAQSTIEMMYQSAGYKMPKVVYWHICVNPNGVPVTKHKSGAMLISGFSPSILKYLFDLLDPNPLNLVEKVLLSDRYSLVK